MHLTPQAISLHFKHDDLRMVPDKRNLLERDSNPEMAGLDFGYAQTKWVSEQLVLQAREQGIDARIYRPAFLTASTAGFGHSTDIVVRLLSFMIKYGVAPNADIQLSFMPVDIAAHNIAAVMTSHRVPGASFSCDSRRVLQHR